jgi:dTDP-glucose 4,6-dehydratase
VKIVVDQERLRPEKSEVMRLLSDNRKANELLSWHPQVDLKEGLKNTIKWIQKHLDLYRVGEYEQ